MILLSVNVSLAKQIEYKNKSLATGIFKQPVAGNVNIDQFNLEGDQQVDLANHGGKHKAVYAFSSEHYDYWKQELKLNDISYGRFGENLTISQLDEDKLCIGDRLQIGSAILEITQPRCSLL